MTDYTENLRDRINRALMALFADKEPASLYEPMVHLFRAGGKRIRPLLLMLTCEAVSGKTEDCFQAALAVELLHTFTLVHDDIMDHDDLRRGRPTVHKKWDESTAILAGDGLVTMAYQTLLQCKHPRLVYALQVFTDGLMLLCEGQALDKAFETRNHVSLEEYENMIELKTAKLIQVACTVGAILGNGTPDEQKNMACFALNLGKAFQIQDDLLDLLSNEDISGKPKGSDLGEKKKTYLTIHFMNNALEASRTEFENLWEKDKLSGEDVARFESLFEAAGTLQSARDKVNGYTSDALNCLDILKEGKAKKYLKNLALKIQNRVS